VTLQVNASSLLGKGQWFHALRAKKYYKLELIDVIASDSHDEKKTKILRLNNLRFRF
jgi:tyrosine-protein phosphatase YwqE